MNDLEFMPISIATLLPTETVGLNLYQLETESERPVLYRARSFR